jgi:hypothetical protein
LDREVAIKVLPALAQDTERLARFEREATVLDNYDRAVLPKVYPGGFAMRSKRAVLIAGVSLLFVPTAVLAHHRIEAQFDTKQTITLTGVVRKIDWSNPHVRLYIEVKDESNAVSNWELYMGSPNQQMMNGWRIDSFRRGDNVTVDAYRARDGSNVGYARNVKLTAH